MLRRYRELEVSPSTFRRWADVLVAFVVLVISAGAAVRLTGSGLGCPDWPRCNGSFVPEMDVHAWIEYGNRILSGLTMVPVLAVLIFARRRVPYRRDLVRPSYWLLGGLLTQGALGGITVKLEITWWMVMAHFLLAMVLLTIAVVIAWRARRPEAPEERTPENDARVVALSRALALFGALVVVLGTFATAAGPHAGGAGTGDVVERITWWGPETLRRLIHTHGHLATTLGVCCVALFFYARAKGASRGLVRAIGAAAVLMAVQGGVGLIQYHADLPAALVWFHASAAAVLLIAFICTALEAGRPAPVTTPGVTWTRSRSAATRSASSRS